MTINILKIEVRILRLWKKNRMCEELSKKEKI